MALSADATNALAGLSRELCFALDARGVITAIDDRADRAGLVIGTALREHALEGTEAKVDDLMRRAGTEKLRSWELALNLRHTPVTIHCSTVPTADGVAVCASVVAQDIVHAMTETTHSMQELVDLNRQLAKQKVRLAESDAGIRALHGEIASQVDRLRSSAEVKDRLIAGVSHELRTPLHSILGLSRLLLDGSDGPLHGEQRTQIEFIRSSAEDLSRMVHDMLDLARLDGGNPPLRAEAFELHDFLSALRGTMTPLVPWDRTVKLVFDEAVSVPLETDLGKLSQIARNLISNALKFTPEGTVRVTATLDGDDLRLVVADTGIGIAQADQERVFKEFVQIDSPLQRRLKGTGLGLTLVKKLVMLLRGTLDLESELGTGTTFTVTVPLVHPEVDRFRALEHDARELDPTKTPVLVVEDDRDLVFAYEHYLSNAGFQVLPARTTSEAREVMRRVKPSAILLDVMLEGEDTWSFLADLKRAPETKDIPVLVCTVMNRESHARALGADEFWLKPVDQDRLIRKLDSFVNERGPSVLVIDDDETARYVVKRMLVGTPYKLMEASEGMAGVALAREHKPSVILLDFLLDNMTAFDVLDELKADPRTRAIPVIIVTSQALPLEDRQRLGQQTTAILSKENLSRELAIHRIRDALSSAGIQSDGRKP